MFGRSNLLKDLDNQPLLLSKYQVRLLDTRKDSASFIAANREVLIIDLPKLNSDEVFQYDCHHDPTKTNGEESDDDGEGPLQFSFLTLDKLNRAAEDTELRRIDINYSTGIIGFETTPIPSKEAIVLRQILIQKCSEYFDISVNKLPILVVAKANDGLGSVFFGLQKPANRRIMTLNTKFLGVTKDSTVDSINQLRARVSGVRSRCEATAFYNVLPHRVRKNTNIKSGRLMITFTWPENLKATLVQPAPTATGRLLIGPGWRDNRFGGQLLVNELDQLLGMCHVLQRNDIEQMKWPGLDASNNEATISKEIQKIVESCQIGTKESQINKQETRRYLDMTEQLWGVLKRCESLQQLVRAIRLLFDSLATGTAKALVHENNKTTLARLIKDATNNELILPRLEGLTPIQILAEIGAEKVSRDIRAKFLQEKLIRDEELILQHLNLASKKFIPVEERAMKLKNMLLALQTMLEMKRYLKTDEFKLFEFGSEVVNFFADVAEEKLNDAAYEISLPYANFNPAFFEYFKPLVWMSEVTYNCGGNREISYLIHFTRFSRFDHLNSLVMSQNEMIECSKEQDEIIGDQEMASPKKKRVRDSKDLDMDMENYSCSFTTISTTDLPNWSRGST